MKINSLLGKIITAFILAAVTTLSASGATHAHKFAARQLLLTPQVHRGQSLAWSVTVTDRSVVPSKDGAKEHFETLRGTASRTILNEIGNAFTVSRTFSTASPVVSSASGKVVHPIAVEPPIVVRGGHEFKIGGASLLQDPTCKFYSASMFGDPPSAVSDGVSWDYRQPLGFRAASWVHVAVVSIDKLGSRIRLHITTRIPNTDSIRCQVDMSIEAGGLIASEIDNCLFASVSTIPSEIGTPNTIIIWTLKRD